MSVCVRCAREGNRYSPLIWDDRGRLVHALYQLLNADDESLSAAYEFPDCLKYDAESCGHEGVECDDLDCTPAPGFAVCASCGLAIKAGALVAGEFHLPMTAEGGISLGRRELHPLGSDRAYFYRARDWEQVLATKLPPGSRGAIIEEWPSGPVLVCQGCAERTGRGLRDGRDGRTIDKSVWRPLKGRGEREDGGEAGAADPIDGIPADGEWRTIEESARLAGYGLRNGKPLVRQWARDGLLEVAEQPTGAGGSSRKMYRRPVQ